MLTAELRAHLAKVAGLASSCNPHEAQAAIGRMVALCQKEGVSLTDIIAPHPNELAAKAAKAANKAEPVRASHAPAPAVLLRSHQRTARRLLASNVKWGEWEQGFLNSMLTWRNNISDKQETQLRGLSAKAGGDSCR